MATKAQYLRAEIERLKRQPTDECVEWPFTREYNGYGRLRFGSKNERVHRVAYELFHGRKPQGYVLHRCHNPACYNPRHLVDGTQVQNMRDKFDQGRHRSRGPRRNGRFRLSIEQVGQLLAMRSHGASYRDLSQRFDIHQSTLYFYLHGNSSYQNLRDQAAERCALPDRG